MKIRLIFHTGYGKTATTTLQRAINQISKENNILFLGKDKENFISQEFKEIYYDVFRGFRYESNSFQHPSRIIFYKLDFIVNIIFELLIKSKKTTVYLSDENLGGYSNYNADQNYSYLKYIGEELERKLSELNYITEKTILLTIRNHVDIINSCLPYNREKINSKMFSRLENKEDLYFGSLDYYKHKIFLEKFMEPWKIKFVPMEIIFKEGLNDFIKEVTFKDISIHGNLNIHENSNVDSKSRHIMRRTNFINVIMFRKSI